MVAQLYAIRYSPHLNGLILYDTPPKTDQEWGNEVASRTQWFKKEPWFSDASAAMQADSASYYKNDRELTAVYAREWPLYVADYTAHKKAYDQIFAQMRASLGPALGFEKEANTFNTLKDLPRITARTLIIVGDKDFLCSVESAENMNRAITHSKLVVLKNAGHLGHFETPDAFTQAVTEFQTTP